MKSPKICLGLLAAVCLHSASAHADRIYQLPDDESSTEQASAKSMRSLSTAFADSKVVDLIPELGIVVVKSAVARDLVGGSGLRDLGEVGRVQLITPRIERNLAVPSGLWGLKAIDLSEAWKVTRGAGIIVAVSDTGVSASHPELKTQMWKNPGETGVDSKGRSKETNGVDDDGDGYVDDVYGWNFVTKKNGGSDNHFHGTHVAGTIAGLPTSSMSGVAPSARIMDVSFLDKKGSGSDVNGAKSIVFAADHGAKIINCSWGGTTKNALVEKAIEYAQKKGVLVIAAAGNDGVNNDKKSFFPSGYAPENIVAIGATSNASGWRASFSNYGQTTVDLAAPGENIYSLAPGGGHATLSGTSMATPHVSGVAALVLAAHPQYSYAHVKRALMSGAVSSEWKTKSVSGRLLNAELAITQ